MFLSLSTLVTVTNILYLYTHVYMIEELVRDYMYIYSIELSDCLYKIILIIIMKGSFAIKLSSEY